MKMPIILLIGIFLLSCNSAKYLIKYDEMKMNRCSTPGMHYFTSIRKATNVPMLPSQQVPKEEALQRETYCTGLCDSNQNFVKVECYRNGLFFLGLEYDYYPNGYTKVVKEIDGRLDTIVSTYSVKGKVISRKVFKAKTKNHQ